MIATSEFIENSCNEIAPQISYLATGQARSIQLAAFLKLLDELFRCVT